jgi:hypothetical protein
MTEPLKVKADSTNVDSLINSMNALSSVETLDLSTEAAEKKETLLQEYGLSEKLRETSDWISVTTPDGKEWTLYIGTTHPITEGYFAVYKDNLDKILILPGYFQVNFNRDLTYWRDKKLFTFTVAQVESFRVDGPKGKFSAVKKDPRWQITEPEQLPGDLENIESLLNAAILAQAKAFADENKNSKEGKALLNASAESLKIWIKKENESEQLLLKVYANPKAKDGKSKIYATVSNLDPIFIMDDSFLERVNRSVKDIRQVKLITTMERFGTRKIQINDREFYNDQGTWKNTSGSQPAPTDKIQELLDKLSGNRIHDFLKSGAPSPNDPQFKLALLDESGKVLHRFQFWKNSKNQIFSKPILDGNAAETVYVMDPGIAQSLPFDEGFFQDSMKK